MDKLILDKETPQKIFITVHSEIECPICKIVKDKLSWFEDEYYPHIIINESFIGQISPRVREGTMLSIQHIGYNSHADRISGEFLSPDGAKLTPVTVVNNKYVIYGADIFISKINELLYHEPKPSQLKIMGQLSQGEQDAIELNLLDAVDYGDWMHDNIIYPLTGISNKKVLDELKNTRSIRDNIFQKIIEATQKNGIRTRKSNPT